MSSQTVSVGGQSHICHLGPHASHPNRTVTHTKRATCNMSASSHRRQPEWQVACKAYDVDSHAKNRSSSSSATHSCPWEDYDLVILGDGTGATLAAWTFASLGQRVAVVERKYIGGSCPNIACLPSKNIVQSARVASYFRRGKEFGAMTDSFHIDMPVVRERKRAMGKRVVLAVLMRGVKVMYPHSVMWIHNWGVDHAVRVAPRSMAGVR